MYSWTATSCSIGRWRLFFSVKDASCCYAGYTRLTISTPGCPTLTLCLTGLENFYDTCIGRFPSPPRTIDHTKRGPRHSRHWGGCLMTAAMCSRQKHETESVGHDVQFRPQRSLVAIRAGYWSEKTNSHYDCETVIINWLKLVLCFRRLSYKSSCVLHLTSRLTEFWLWKRIFHACFSGLRKSVLLAVFYLKHTLPRHGSTALQHCSLTKD